MLVSFMGLARIENCASTHASLTFCSTSFIAAGGLEVALKAATGSDLRIASTSLNSSIDNVLVRLARVGRFSSQVRTAAVLRR